MSVYLDHAATTPMFDVAIEAMNASLRKLGNPSSLHTEGRSTRKDVEDARETRRSLLSPVLSITQFLIPRTGWSSTKALNLLNFLSAAQALLI